GQRGRHPRPQRDRARSGPRRHGDRADRDAILRLAALAIAGLRPVHNHLVTTPPPDWRWPGPTGTLKFNGVVPVTRCGSAPLTHDQHTVRDPRRTTHDAGTRAPV